MPAGNHDPVSRLGYDRLLANPELQLTCEDLEPLFLRGMDVCRGDGAVGIDVRLDDDRFPVGVGRGLAEHQRLAGDGILDGLAGSDHICLLGLAGRDATSLGSTAFDPFKPGLRER